MKVKIKLINKIGDFEIYLVDGSVIRKNIDPDFTNFGQHYRFDFIPEKEQDLFSAHEVCQMKLVWEKERTYQKFLKANQWSQEFLPNWKP